MYKSWKFLAMCAGLISVVACESNSNDVIDLYPVRVNGKFQYITAENTVAIPAQFKNATTFYDGLALVANEDSLFGYINRKGEYVIPAVYKSATRFSEGKAWAAVEGGWTHLLDTKGNILDSTDAERTYIFKDGIHHFEALSLNEDSTENKGLYGAKNAAGEVIVPPIYTSFYYCNEGIMSFRIEDDSSYIYLNKEGEPLLDQHFTKAPHFFNGIASVSMDDKYGIINTSGIFVIPAEYDYLSTNGLQVDFEVDSLHGFMTPTGEITIQPQFKSLYYFMENELVPAKTDSLFGFINQSGIFIIAEQYRDARPFVNGYAWVKPDKKWGMIDESGAFIIQPQFNEEDMSTDMLNRLDHNNRGIHNSFNYCQSSYLDMNAIIEDIDWEPEHFNASFNQLDPSTGWYSLPNYHYEKPLSGQFESPMWWVKTTVRGTPVENYRERVKTKFSSGYENRQRNNFDRKMDEVVQYIYFISSRKSRIGDIVDAMAAHLSSLDYSLDEEASTESELIFNHEEKNTFKLIVHEEDYMIELVCEM